jgi:hypothetical protein
MKTEPLIFADVCDWAGVVRGKAFSDADVDARLKKGVGLMHSNIMMSAFGPILTDACATLSEERHLTSIANNRGYCRQRTTEQMLEELAVLGDTTT